jgi:hydroxymethylpyrimidine pyrophosphatase-like HAD family hydrolase
MNALPPIPEPGIILSFDFDGTLHDPASDPPVPPSFFQKILSLRESHRAFWGINTGRSMAHLVDGLLESRFPFLPDWVVAREREIYFPDDSGRWLPHAGWNKRCEQHIHQLFKQARKLLVRVRKEIEEHTGAQWMDMAGEPAGVISRTDEEMAWIVNHITPMIMDEPLLSWQRNSIYLRFGHRDYQKGSCLAEVARLHGLSACHCFAIGDSHNDFEMLDPQHVAMAACPANSVTEIKEAVIARDGLVTTGIHGDGVVEALEYFFPE